MSMKCRCGSDDKLILKSGAIVRKNDNQPHVCLGQDKPTDFSNDDYLKNKQKEIQEKPTTKSKPAGTKAVIDLNLPISLQNFVTVEHAKIKSIENILTDLDVTLAKNPQKLGMYIKIIADNYEHYEQRLKK